MTRIEQDGTMQRRMVDTAQRDDDHLWEDLIARALASAPPYQPIPGTAVYHISVGGRTVQVGEYDLDGALRHLVTVVLAMGEALAQLARSRAGQGEYSGPQALPFPQSEGLTSPRERRRVGAFSLVRCHELAPEQTAGRTAGPVTGFQCGPRPGTGC